MFRIFSSFHIYIYIVHTSCDAISAHHNYGEEGINSASFRISNITHQITLLQRPDWCILTISEEEENCCILTPHTLDFTLKCLIQAMEYITWKVATLQILKDAKKP